jgi:hypothetical protein
MPGEVSEGFLTKLTDRRARWRSGLTADLTSNAVRNRPTFEASATDSAHYAQRNTAAPPTDFGAPAEVDYFASREW